MPSAFVPPPSDPWSARPSDPQDVFLAQTMRPGNARVGLFGVPYDGAVIGRKGAREGPAAIREHLAKLKTWTLADGEPALAVRDWGDVRLDPAGPVAAAHEATVRAAREVLDAGQFPVALGGDHSLTYPLVMAHQDKRRRLGVINLDAHLDVRDVHNGVLNSGQSFGRLIESGFVPGKNLVEIGIRDFANSPRYAEKARKAGATILGADEWRADPRATLDHAIEIASHDADGVYLSVDVDVLDQAHAPGVSAPTPGGIDSNTLFAAIRRIAQRAPLVGADIMEVAPPLDKDGMTSRAAAYATAYLLAALPAKGGA